MASGAAACGGDESAWVLPDRTDPEVLRTESKLAGIVEVGKGWEERWETCEVRLLGGTDPTYYVWAECSRGISAVSLPLRIEGETVTGPRDGGYFADDVRALFPEDLAEAMFEQSELLRP